MLYGVITSTPEFPTFFHSSRDREVKTVEEPGMKRGLRRAEGG